MKIQRYYTKAGEHPLKKVGFRRVRLNAQTYRAPKTWSDQAIQIFASKYCRHPLEKDFARVFHRLALAYQSWARKLKIFKSKQDLKIFYDEILWLLANQFMAPNSPQWFNTGLFEAYSIKGEDQGHFALNLKNNQIEPVKHCFERPQAHACFIQSVQDTLVGPDGLMDLLKKEARLFKFGSGSGTNFSSLRAQGEQIKHGGVSSGVLSFLKVSDRSAGAISSGGTTRRAAKMVILDDDHPEVMEFIRWKSQEEIKALALIQGQRQLQMVEKKWNELKHLSEIDFINQCKQMNLSIELIKHFLELQKNANTFEAPRWTTGFEGEIAHTLTGQNANHSVSVSDKLIKAIDQDADWALKTKKAGRSKNKIKARQLWKELALSAWNCADPGVVFKDTLNRWNPCPKDGPIRATNPCGEYIFLDDTACNLASINLLKFEKKSGEFDIQGFEHTIDLLIIILECTVSMASYPSELIAQRSVIYRTLGLGITNLGALLMRRGLAYDSDQARELSKALVSLMSARSWSMSCHLAETFGAYEAFERNKKFHLAILKKHAKASKKIQINDETRELTQRATQLWSDVLLKAQKRGVRNAQTTLIAPTGTISLIMDCDTFGIEPEFSLMKKKFLAGGGELQFLNSTIEATLQLLDYNSKQIEELKAELEQTGDFRSSKILSLKHQAIFHCARDISPRGHLLMMAALQPFLSGGISKTINLPQSSDINAIQELYGEAYRLGLKAVAIYRENSKMSEPLLAIKELNLKCLSCGQSNMLLLGRCYLCQDCGETSACA